MQIDVLVKNEKHVKLKKNIGRIFRQYNIIEYKSPEDGSGTGRQRHILPHRDAIPIQLVIVPKLSKEHNYWLNNLRNDLKAGSEIKKIIETSYGKSTLNSLKNTENFTDSAIEHIFEGQVNARGKAVGYHYEGIEGTSGNVIPGTESSTNNFGIYKAKVEVNGIPKTANGGFSSFYPKSMSPQEVIGSINEAYRNRVYIRGNTYSGLTSSGMEIEMFLDKNGKIISAYPVY